WQIPAKVRTVIPTADRQKATVKVRATFERLDPRILPDMGVKVTFLGEERGAPTEAGRVLISRAALVEQGGTTAVFVHRDGKVERRAVRLGQARGHEPGAGGGPPGRRAGGHHGSQTAARRPVRSREEIAAVRSRRPSRGWGPAGRGAHTRNRSRRPSRGWGPVGRGAPNK